MMDEPMLDFLPFEHEDSTSTAQNPNINATPFLSAASHFHSIHPEIEALPFKCVCGRYFKAQKDQRQHQKSSGHGCCVCGEAFTTYPELHRHRYQNAHMVRCTCSRLFISIQHLRSHQRIEGHQGFLDTKNGPVKNLATESTTLDEILCACGESIQDVELSLNGTTSLAPPVRCPSCSEYFQDAHSQARAEFGPGTVLFPCCCCSRSFHDWDTMWAHELEIHHTCISCHWVFISESRLMAHQRQTGHCYCAACDEHFLGPDRLRQHLVEHHGISRAEVFKDVLEGLPTEQGGEDQPLKGGLKAGANFLDMDLRCRVCGKEFTSPKTLHDHRTRGWHDPFTKVECPFGCDGRQYPSLSTLLHHLEDGNQCESGIKLHDFNDLMRGEALERFVLPQYRLQPVPRSPDFPYVKAENAHEFAVYRAQDPAAAEGSELLGLRCPVCCTNRIYATITQLNSHLKTHNHTPKFLQYPDYVIVPPTKSLKKTDFNSWSALVHSIESLLCAGQVEGVQKALDLIEARLRTLCMEEADDKMID